uniref:3'-5' exonuclease domain-containing protein n=1 Tax=Romanomermis culicivorax TaxID=13658 RepID=A0A915J7G1_ROMCU
MAFAKVTMMIAADHWRICQISPPLIKHEAIVTFGQELGRLPLNGRYIVCTTVEESQMMCDFLANNPCHPGVYGLDAEFMNHHMDWVDWDKKEAGPLANLAKRKLDIALHGQRYSKGPFAVIIQISRVDGHTVIFDLLEMGVIPISLIDLLKSARGIVRFAANCDLTAMAN